MYEFAITCDGGSRNNQDPENREGYGSWMIAAPHMVNKIKTKDFGNVTNNEAEYMALIEGLIELSDAFTAVGADLKTIKIIVRTDSQLIIGQLSQNWKINKPHLIPLVVQAKALCSQFYSVTFEKINEKDMKRILGH